jgi:hypothetical protein
VQRDIQESHQKNVLSGYPIAFQPDEKHVNDGKQATHATADESGGSETPATKFDELKRHRHYALKAKHWEQ